MILVTVGTHPQGFDRLVKAADELGALIDEQVFIQYGSSTYIPRHAESFRFTNSQEMEELTHAARLVVTHAAAGAVILALKQQKRLVVTPRLKQYGEVFDDHQLQLARALESQKRAQAIFELSPAALAAAVNSADESTLATIQSDGLIQAIQNRLAAWEGLIAP